LLILPEAGSSSLFLVCVKHNGTDFLVLSIPGVYFAQEIPEKIGKK